ncbi:hypothetical protein [Pelosinus fermentans]|nr:hypothetical protein [Pelosinus fermentans]
MKKSIGAKTFGMPLPVWFVGTYYERPIYATKNIDGTLTRIR